MSTSFGISYFEVVTLSDSDAIRDWMRFGCVSQMGYLLQHCPLRQELVHARFASGSLNAECHQATYEAYEGAVDEAFEAEVAAIAPYLRGGLVKEVMEFRKDLRKSFLLHRYFDIVKKVLLKSEMPLYRMPSLCVRDAILLRELLNWNGYRLDSF